MQTKFNVFGQPVEMLVASSATNGSYSVGRQMCAPGTGTPPHLHQNEDEMFSVVSGRFEIYDGDTDTWTEVAKDAVVFAPRGHVHCFRNSGDADGVIQFVAGGATFDVFLEGLARFELPGDLQAIVDYSAGYGISYPTLPPPTIARQHDEVVALASV